MSDRRMVAVWSGVALAAFGATGVLVAVVGWDRANMYLGVPAATAALVGLVVSVYALRGSDVELANSKFIGRRTHQRAKTSGKSYALQIGGSVDPAASRRAESAPSVSEIDQRARARDGSWIEQVGENWSGGGDDAARE